jgi:hypothetical protein
MIETTGPSEVGYISIFDVVVVVMVRDEDLADGLERDAGPDELSGYTWSAINDVRRTID